MACEECERQSSLLEGINDRLDRLIIALREQAGDQGLSDEASKTGQVVLGVQKTIKSSGGDQVTDVIYATFKKPKACCLKIQCANSTGNVGLVVTVAEGVYGATFRRVFQLLNGGPPKTMRLFGRTINVSVQTPLSAETTFSGTVNAVLASENLDVLGELFAQFFPWVQTLSSQQTLVNGAGTGIFRGAVAGYLLGGEGYVSALGTGDAAGTSYFAQWFDFPSTASLGPGVTPIYEVGPLPVGSQFSFGHELRVDIPFSQGLVVAFSKTPQVYTQVGNNAVVRADTSAGF